MIINHNCRHCGDVVRQKLMDLGFSPPSNSYLSEKQLSKFEKYFPLRVNVCSTCWLAQTEDYADRTEFFDENYAYLSSVSSSWLKHAKKYSDQIISRLNLSEQSFVIEIAANDGYLLKNFVEKKIPCLGIEPTKSTASAAEKIGIPIIQDFFGASLANELTKGGKFADLIVANNVYAHVPDINDFTLGMKILLVKGGTITIEFPHLMNLILECQFDTIYHEHYSYLSLFTVSEIFRKYDLKIIDVEEVDTHGGSLRVFGCHSSDLRSISKNVDKILDMEFNLGMQKLDTYNNFQFRADAIKNSLLQFLLENKKSGMKMAAYGAAAKGNTFLNYAGVRSDLLECVFDYAPSKNGKFLPGSHIPIIHPKDILEIRPDILLILPWNIKNEVVIQHSYIREWGGRFVIAIPELKIF